ncbi:MAG: hypothetical protein GX058_01485 [Firmicutes bacterium]|nr:hypothetical protein [Bacillota bacterium]
MAKGQASGLTTDLLREIESVINQITGVIASRLVTDRSGKLIEIHVLYDGKRAPKYLAQDIQTLLTSRWNLTIDKNIISIARIGQKEKSPQAMRVQICGIETCSRGLISEVSVELGFNGQTKRGTAAGADTVANKMRLVATAVLNSLAQFLPDTCHLILEGTAIERVAHNDVVVSCVTILYPNRQETLLGTCIIERDLILATVRATLDSLNRRFAVLAAG